MGFLDFLSGAFGGISQFLADVLQFLIALVNVIMQVLVFIWNGLLSVFQWALKTLKSIGTFFSHLWENFFKNIFTKVLQAIRTAHQWLEAHLRPVINFLKKVRAIVDRIYKLYIKPYLQFLQKLRRWLQILKLLHIKWAEALDRRLARTEAEISRGFLLVRGTLNDLINFVNAVADPARLSRMVMVSIAGRRTAGAVIRAVTGLPLGFFFPHTGKGALPFEKPVFRASQLQDPATNPPASQILAGLLPLPVSGFDSPDPTPDDAELDSLETSPYFGELGDALLAGDLAYAAMEDFPVSLLDAIENRVGPLVPAAGVVESQLQS